MRMCRVRWHVAVEGNEADLHNMHWHGNTLLWENHNADQCASLPKRAFAVHRVASASQLSLAGLRLMCANLIILGAAPQVPASARCR